MSYFPNIYDSSDDEYLSLDFVKSIKMKSENLSDYGMSPFQANPNANVRPQQYIQTMKIKSENLSDDDVSSFQANPNAYVRPQQYIKTMKFKSENSSEDDMSPVQANPNTDVMSQQYIQTMNIKSENSSEDDRSPSQASPNAYVMPQEHIKTTNILSDNELSPIERKTHNFFNVLRNHRRNINRSKIDPKMIPDKNLKNTSNTETMNPLVVKKSDKRSVRRSLPIHDRPSAPRKRGHSIQLYKPPPQRSNVCTPTRMLSECDLNDCSPDKRQKMSRDILPIYEGYELLGDSQLLRFAEQCLNFRYKTSYTPDTKSRCLAYCVSGQKIEDLQRRLSLNEYEVKDKVILLIGTNDFLRHTPLTIMYEHFSTLLENLKNKTKRIVILTVPPIPKFNNVDSYIKDLVIFNNFLLKHHDGNQVHVIDISSHYVGFNNLAIMDYFEETFGNSTRIDRIHLNYNGFRFLQSLLQMKYFDRIRD